MKIEKLKKYHKEEITKTKKVLKIVGRGFLLFCILLFAFSFTSILYRYDSFKMYCAEEFSGVYQSGYCIYIVNGTSFSFPYDLNWSRGHTDFFGGLKK